MAWLELKPSGFFHIVFRLGNQKVKRSLKTKNRRTAEGRLAGVEATLQVLESGRLSVPEGVDIVSFLLSDGRLSKSIVPTPVLTISALVARFIEALPPHSMEENSLATLRLHVRHICRIVGSKTTLNALDLAAVQRYVSQRSCEKGSRGKRISAVTIRKEIASLRSVWNWGRTQGLIDRPFPSKGLRFPKADEKPPFRTRSQIERLVETAHLTRQQTEELWDGLFLYPHEAEELLDIIASRSPRAVEFDIGQHLQPRTCHMTIRAIRCALR